jgi:hypothetical protein
MVAPSHCGEALMLPRRLKPLFTSPGKDGDAARSNSQMAHDVSFGRLRGNNHQIGLSAQAVICRRHCQTMLASHPLWPE